MSSRKGGITALMLAVPFLTGLFILGVLFRTRAPSAAANGTQVALAPVPPAREVPVAVPRQEPELPPVLPVQEAQPVETSLEFEAQYAKVFARFEQAAKHPLDVVVNRMQYECYSVLREVRLLALSSPKEMHAKCVSIIRSPSADSSARDLAISALGILAREGFKDSENELFILAKNDSTLAFEAIRSLAAVDREGRYVELFRQRAAEGLETAFEALSVWPDAVNKQLMKELQGEEKPPGSQFMAQTVRERFDILSSPNWQVKLREIIESTQQGIPMTLWAIRAAEIRKMPNLLDAMRVRLDQAEAAARGTLSQFQATATAQGQDHPKFDDLFTQSATVQGLWDDAFDEVLVAFSAKGGKLTSLEKTRLETFGYLGSPQKYLEELLNGKK